MSSTEYQKQWQRDRRKKLQLAGLCTACGKSEPEKGRMKCTDCLGRAAKTNKSYSGTTYVKRRELGLCGECGEPAEGNRSLCPSCNQKRLDRYYDRKTQGRCSSCPERAIPGTTRCEKCRVKYNQKNRTLRDEVIAAYGGPSCSCCGETIDRFLTIDHINNDGKAHREAVGTTSVFRDLKNRGFPSGFQVLCFNCNQGRQLNGGICPHKEKEQYDLQQG